MGLFEAIARFSIISFFCLQDTRICIPVPLYHCFGMVLGSLQCLAHGTTAVYPAPSFEPAASLQAVQEER